MSHINEAQQATIGGAGHAFGTHKLVHAMAMQDRAIACWSNEDTGTRIHAVIRESGQVSTLQLTTTTDQDERTIEIDPHGLIITLQDANVPITDQLTEVAAASKVEVQA